MTMKSILLTALIATPALAGHSPVWHEFGADKQGIAWSVDTASVDFDRVTGIASFLVNSELPAPRVEHGVSYTQINYMEFVNCQQHTYTNAQMFFFSGTTKVDQSEYNVDPWQPALPGTVSMLVLQFVCASSV